MLECDNSNKEKWTTLHFPSRFHEEHPSACSHGNFIEHCIQSETIPPSDLVLIRKQIKLRNETNVCVCVGGGLATLSN